MSKQAREAESTTARMRTFISRDESGCELRLNLHAGGTAFLWATPRKGGPVGVALPEREVARLFEFARKND